MLSKEECKTLCKCITGCIFVLGILAILCMFAVGKSPDPPEFSIRRFYVPNLNKTFTDLHYKMIDTISVDLGFEIKDKTETDIYYDTLKISLYYYLTNATAGDDVLLRIPVGNISLHHFKQSNITKHALDQTVQTFGIPWKEAKMAVSNGGNTTFLVDLVSDVRYRKLHGLVITKTYKVKACVNVTVNDHGAKSVPEFLKFTSAS
ncbi:uncharacterized protein LOC113329195 [Papaver somniferum]|uniref:uncharacterized protein LOC113329195 n=1 Tax=Papaver somniferum TaxID=3469 RepID=UPI000E6F755A|nr:uncharacterized protein LOC113329195 [Papaver somniferum]